MLTRKNSMLLACSFMLVSASFFASCKKHCDPQPPANKDIRLVEDKQFGSILTDKDGRTLYFFSIDASGNSGCTGNCIVAWPVFYKNAPTLDPGLNSADFAVITRSDGAKQTTYKGWPLYYFANDAKAGDTKGEGLNNVWYVAKPDYTVMLVAAQLVGHDGKNYKSDYTEGTGFTQYLTDDWGKTLYSFSPDKFKKNNFTKPDFSNNPVWPIYESKVLKVPSTLAKSDFDVIDVFGKVQLTFKGWPMYHFGQDNGVRGSNKGVSFPRPGIWPVVNGSSKVAPE